MTADIVRVARPDSLPATTDRFVVVEASAGTGKTFFLEHRVVDLVLGGGELGQILLVTFTDKAVAELRLRIRDLLDRLSRASESTDKPGAWELDPAAKKRLRDAVTAFDHAPIFTIHGFCYRILVEDAFAAQRLFAQTQVADEVAFDAAFIALLRERFARDLPDRDLLSAYLSRGDTVDKLRALLLACARKDAPPRATYMPDAALELGESLRFVFGTQVSREALLGKLPLKGADKTNVPRWIELIGQAVDAWDGGAAGVFALCDAVRRTQKIEPGAKLLARVIKVPELAPIGELLKRALVMTSLDEAIAAVMLPQVIARITADKAETGMFDYNDMLQLVRDALHGPRGAELATRMRTRTPWVMIDEFQDTDPVQWNIFRTVWMDPAARGLTIVGDPKQAIYGFRGADVATYMDARDELVRNGATRVDLDVNRRSTAPLVEAVNKILLADGISPMLDQTIRYDHPVRASGDVELAGARRPITVFQLTGPGRREESRQALAAAIGAEIEALRAAPPAWTSRGTAAPFSLGHCMVLTRTNSDSDGVAQALRSRGLACALVEGDRLFETREAHELADVLAAVAAPRDRSARMRALRTRFFDVPWADLMRVVDAPDHHPLIARLFDWAALATRRAYESLFRELVEDSRFAERALVLGGGERAIINTWHLIELLLEEVARSRSDLHELVTQLRRWIADGSELPDDRDVQRAETDLDAVRILTVHKAKGLEAPYVFVYGAASPPRASNVHTLRDGAGRALVVGPQDDATAKQLVAEADAENQRLAYVALTRAKVALYLPRYPDEVVDSKSMYWAIQRCLAPLASRKDELFELREVVMGVPQAPPAPADALAGFEPPPPPVVAELAALAPQRMGLAMLSYTRLGKELDAAAIEPGELPVAIDPAEFAAEPESPAEVVVGPDELPPGIDSGLLLHDLFEHADLALLRDRDLAAWTAEPSVREMIVTHARERGIAQPFYAHAARLVHAALTEPLAVVGRDPLPPLVEATAFAREVEFAYPIPGHRVPADQSGKMIDQRGLVKGYIDALVAWDDDLWVLDYKSDILAGDPVHAAADHARSHYTIQQRLYALAADRMKGARRVAGMLFAFVRYGVVVALPCDDAKLEAWTDWLGESAHGGDLVTTLHPRGTLRARFEPRPDQDAVFRRLALGARACDLGDEGLYLAEEIVAADRWFGGSDPEALGILVLALMIAQRQGSTRLPLDPAAKGQLRQLVGEILRIAGHEGNAAQIMKRIVGLTAEATFNSVIGTGDARLPLIVDDQSLYTERARYLEGRVALRLAERIAPPILEVAAPIVKSNVIPFRPNDARFLEAATKPTAITIDEPKLTPEQRAAVELALSGKLTVVTGGPGTGKTLVAAAIVRGFHRMGITEVALAAPTGKAANRLTEVIAKELATGAPIASLATPPVAQTLHRTLGYRGHGFAHHARSPLPIGALIVDEASMIDLELVDALLDALPASAPLVLIGDAHQLPAVDAGRILADLADPEGAASARVAVLTHSHRMDAADPRGRQVLDAAQAIHRGDGAALFAAKAPLATARTPGTLAFSGVEWVDAAKGAAVARAVTTTAWHHFGGPKAQAIANDTVFRFVDGEIVADQATALAELWDRISRARILTATRGLPTGARALNAHLHELALDSMTVAGKPEFVPGEPVMITANDYQRGLYNGDQGIIVRADEGTGHHRYRAVFRVGTRLVPFAIEALRDRLELAWALTIHKSQGSELEAVAIVLPEEDLPLVTRELLYTGITRARTSVVLCGSRAAITKGAARIALRHSGLATRIRAALPAPR